MPTQAGVVRAEEILVGTGEQDIGILRRDCPGCKRYVWQALRRRRPGFSIVIAAQDRRRRDEAGKGFPARYGKQPSGAARVGQQTVDAAVERQACPRCLPQRTFIPADEDAVTGRGQHRRRAGQRDEPGHAPATERSFQELPTHAAVRAPIGAPVGVEQCHVPVQRDHGAGLSSRRQSRGWQVAPGQAAIGTVLNHQARVASSGIGKTHQQCLLGISGIEGQLCRPRPMNLPCRRRSAGQRPRLAGVLADVHLAAIGGDEKEPGVGRVRD